MPAVIWFRILLYKNLKVKVYRTIILPVFYMGVKLGTSLKLRDIG